MHIGMVATFVEAPSAIAALAADGELDVPAGHAAACAALQSADTSELAAMRQWPSGAHSGGARRRRR